MPRIPTMRVVAGLFFALCVRLGSLNAIEEAFEKKGARGKRWRAWMGGALPSADRLGEVAAEIELDDLRRVLLEHHRKRKRKKTLRSLEGNLRVLVFDGHEMCSSYLRCCESCLTREMKFANETRTQYYHRYVMAFLLCEGGRVLLDAELQLPGEGEIAAATRLLKRLLEACPRAFNVVAGDALYLDPDLCRLLLEHNKDFVAVLKNENRDLIKDLRGLLAFDSPKPSRFKYNGKQCTCQDIEGFTSWSPLGRPVRVLRCVETCTIRRQRTKEDEELSSEWLWATSLSKDKANTRTVVRIGHGRWDIENQGFNELATHWHADHVYHHDPNAMVAILLLLFLAYNLFHVWLARGLKPQLRAQHTALHFARLIAAEFYYVLLHPT